MYSTEMTGLFLLGSCHFWYWPMRYGGMKTNGSSNTDRRCCQFGITALVETAFGRSGTGGLLPLMMTGLNQLTGVSTWINY